MKTVKVVFHRHYEIDIKDIYDRLDLNIDDIEEQDIKDEAERIARSYFEEEAPEFIDNSSNFVSATVEIVGYEDI
jgi:hypothetical protein